MEVYNDWDWPCINEKHRQTYSSMCNTLIKSSCTTSTPFSKPNCTMDIPNVSLDMELEGKRVIEGKENIVYSNTHSNCLISAYYANYLIISMIQVFIGSHGFSKLLSLSTLYGALRGIRVIIEEQLLSMFQYTYVCQHFETE